MNIKVLTGSMMISVLLAGCATQQEKFTPKTTVRVVTKIVRQELPPIAKPKPPKLKNVVFDYPRNMGVPPIAKNIYKCKNVPIGKRDVKFYVTCGVQPKDPNSNIFIGVDQANFNKLQFNLLAMKEYAGQLQQRIDLANEQRAASRKKARRNSKQKFTKRKKQ